MFLYYTRKLVRWVGGVHYGDMEVMKAEGQARMEAPRSPGYVSTGYCMLAVGYVESGVVGICECAACSGLRGVTGDGRVHGGGGTQTTRGPLLLRRLRVALCLGCCFFPIGDALAFCLLLCYCVALPCPFTPSEQTGQRPSPLLMLTWPCTRRPRARVAPGPCSSEGTSTCGWSPLGTPPRGVSKPCGNSVVSTGQARNGRRTGGPRGQGTDWTPSF